MCEEDKTNHLSLAYWFRIVDLNGDGIITPDEMLFFYTEQVCALTPAPLNAVVGAPFCLTRLPVHPGGCPPDATYG
jgi:hypothetical protein